MGKEPRPTRHRQDRGGEAMRISAYLTIDISESELKFIKKQGRAELDRASEAFQSLMSVIRHIGGFVSRGAQSDM